VTAPHTDSATPEPTTHPAGPPAQAQKQPYEPPVLEALGQWSVLTVQQTSSFP
jgi:hypothetical protein